MEIVQSKLKRSFEERGRINGRRGRFVQVNKARMRATIKFIRVKDLLNRVQWDRKQGLRVPILSIDNLRSDTRSTLRLFA